MVFDFDGTLITCKPRQLCVLRALLKAYSVRIDVEEVWLHKRNGFTTYQALCKAGLQEIKAGQISNLWQKVVEEPCWLSLDSLFPDTTHCVNIAKSLGINVYLLTARSRPEWFFCQIRHLQLETLFVDIRCVPHFDPERRKAEALLEWSATLFVGDSELDAKAARIARVPFLGVSRGQRSHEYLQQFTPLAVTETLEEALSRIVALNPCDGEVHDRVSP